MAWLVCFICGLAGAGLVVFLMDWLSELFRMSKFEGTNGYLFVFFFTPLAFVGGMIVGALTVWRIGPSGYFRMQGLALLMTVAVFWAVVAVTYLLHQPQAPPPPLSEAERNQALMAEQAAKATRVKKAEEEEAKFQGLTADSSLREYIDARDGIPAYEDREKYNTRREQVIAGAARVKSRQSDAIDLLNEGRIEELDDLWRFSLSATPALCDAYNHAFVKYTASCVANPDRTMFILKYLGEQLPNLKWLAGKHCNVDESLDAYSSAVQLRTKTYNQYEMEAEGIAPLLSTLAELRDKP